MIDTKNLRMLAQAALTGPDGVSLNWVKFLQDFQKEANPATISELLDRLEAVEEEYQHALAIKETYQRQLNETEEERDALLDCLNEGKELAKNAEKERDELRADFETAHVQMMTSAAAEREACAKVCEKLTKPSGPVPGHPIDAWLLATLDCAKVIRARGSAAAKIGEGLETKP